jgi:hypothetical protein
MKILSKSKDGGSESNVTAYWLFEIKWLFSIAILRFDNGSRDAFHSHAFNCISWLLSGSLHEEFVDTRKESRTYWPSLIPIITRTNTFHKVRSDGTSWVLTFRGPWQKTWKEYRPIEQRYVDLTHGRKEVNNA